MGAPIIINCCGHGDAAEILRRLDLMATQEQVDALAGRVQAIGTTVDAIRQDFADFKAAHPELDLSGLEANVTALADQASALDAEYPAVVQPTPEPEPPAEPVV